MGRADSSIVLSPGALFAGIAILISIGAGIIRFTNTSASNTQESKDLNKELTEHKAANIREFEKVEHRLERFEYKIDQIMLKNGLDTTFKRK